jgi:signal peptidase I
VKLKQKSPAGQLLELVLVVGVAIGLALGIQAFLVKPYRIPTPSMVPTLAVGQRVLVNRLGNNFGNPKIGDIVVFHPPFGAGEDEEKCGDPHRRAGQACDRPVGTPAKDTFIKRLVGLPGDTIAIIDGQVIRNGKPTEEPFIRACADGNGCQFPKTITVPAGHYFMMGDNRGDSDDSRYWGPVERDWIIGDAVVTYWPPKRINIF